MRFLFSILLIFPLVSKADVCHKYSVPQVYSEMKADLNKSIQDLSNKKIFASEADSTLSKLITAKSPIVNSWLQKRDLLNSSDEEIVKAWRLYYTENFILSKYPHADSKINSMVEKLVDEALKKHLDKKFKKKIENLFSQAQKTSIKTIEQFKISDTQKKLIISRIKSIKLYWPSNLKQARNNSIPLDLISWGVAYDPIPNEINIGLDALIYPNDETYLAVFAHEIGHSFDSCRWGAFFDGPWPFISIGECLRSDKSITAKKRDDSQLDEFSKKGLISNDLVIGLKNNPTCNKLSYPPPGLQSDQLPEAFADWFSAEVLAIMNNLKTDHLRSDLCEKKELSAGSSYPTNQMRLERIYFAHPRLTKNKKAHSNYCALK